MMKIFDMIDEFQYDWTQSLNIFEGSELKYISNKTFVIVGNNTALVHAFIFSLLNLNDEKKSSITVKFIPEPSNIDDDNTDTDFIKKLNNANRTDLQISELSSELKGDFLICPGICNRDIKQTNSFFEKILSYNEEFLSLCQKGMFSKVIFLSDYRVYGKTDKNYVISEHESYNPDWTSQNNFTSCVLASLESYFCNILQESGISYALLRLPMIYGARLDMQSNFIYKLSESVACGNEIRINHTSSQFSYLYINDVIISIITAITKGWERVFNVAGSNSMASTDEISAMLYKHFPECTNITLCNDDLSLDYGISLSGDKAVQYGWQPTVSLEDGLVMLIKSMKNENTTFCFDNTYQGKLSSVQDLLLTYLLEIDRICKKNNIKYFLAGGTLLGAIRHHGFIPWDDDADVMMLRDDYDRFVQIVQRELPDNLFFQLPETEKTNHNQFAKIRIDNTMFVTEFTSNFMNMHNGIFLDVLSHDKTSNSKRGQKFHIMISGLARGMAKSKWKGTPVNSANKSKFTNSVLTVIRNILPMKFWEWSVNKTLTLYKNNEHSKYLYDGMGRNIKNGAFPIEWLSETIYVDFEGYKLPVPKQYDKYLKYLYGDYSKMITVSRRQFSHDIVMMDLGEYSGYKLRK